VPQRLLKARIRLHGRIDLEHLRDRDHGAGLGVEVLADDRPGPKIDQTLLHAGLAAFVDVVMRDPREGVAGRVTAHGGLVGFRDVDRLDLKVVAPRIMLPED
jgi:hypothetical protein